MELSHHPHGAFPTLFLSTSPLSVRPRAGCLSGQEPSMSLGPAGAAVSLLWTKKDALPSACAPHHFPQLPMAPACGLLPTSPRTGCGCARWVPAPLLAEAWCNPGEQQRHPKSGLRSLETFLLPGSCCQYTVGCCTDLPEPRASGMLLPTGLEAKEDSG